MARRPGRCAYRGLDALPLTQPQVLRLVPERLQLAAQGSVVCRAGERGHWGWVGVGGREGEGWATRAACFGESALQRRSLRLQAQRFSCAAATMTTRASRGSSPPAPEQPQTCSKGSGPRAAFRCSDLPCRHKAPPLVLLREMGRAGDLRFARRAERLVTAARSTYGPSVAAFKTRCRYV
jgi:hypothetical protein